MLAFWETALGRALRTGSGGATYGAVSGETHCGWKSELGKACWGRRIDAERSQRARERSRGGGMAMMRAQRIRGSLRLWRGAEHGVVEARVSEIRG